MMDDKTRALLRALADRYETAGFISGDPSWFMHQVNGDGNREAMAFVASCFSYGSRTQFMPRIQWLLNRADGDMDGWVRSGAFATVLDAADTSCFYRLQTVAHVHRLLQLYRQMLAEHGTMGAYVRREASDGLSAVAALTRWFGCGGGVGGLVPQDTQSACKRVCMFLRWMVRDDSPVDLGLWAGFIDRRTLIMPLDTHVVEEARRLGLLRSALASMSAARRLTAALSEVFPDDPLRGDFALFGYGVDADRQKA